jgi:ribonuclease G
MTGDDARPCRTHERMARQILINVAPWEVRAAVLDRTVLQELFLESPSERGIAGNVYEGRVTRVLPGMHAAFVDVGLPKSAFLHMSDVEPPVRVEAEGDLSDAVETPVAPRPPTLHKGEEILVQVTKEPIGTKGARVTTRISLPGRLLVLTPGTTHVGISRRIENEEERDRLRAICEEVRPEDAGLIVRTACEGASKRELQRDVRYLARLWRTIRTDAETAVAPALLHADLDLVLRLVRDLFTSDVERLTIDRAADHARVLAFVRTFLPRLASRVHLYQGVTPLFEQHGIESKLRRALERRVWLKSGGYLVFDQTESLTTVDVNTGRFVGKTSHAETVLRTNLEAAKEVAHQLRLRNIGGIIVIDFIDMEDPAHRTQVTEALVDAARDDKARINVLAVSDLGLVQMTRKRSRESLEQSLTVSCPACDGLGRVRSARTLAHAALRRIQQETALHPAAAALTVRVHPDVAAYLLGEGRRDLTAAEEAAGWRVTVAADPAIALDESTVSFEPERPATTRH